MSARVVNQQQPENISPNFQAITSPPTSPSPNQGEFALSRPKKITIAGAGLAGSLLAVLLGKRGYEVTVLERRSDMRGKEVDAGRSINLALSSRGIHALKMAGLMEEVQQLLIPMRGRMLHFENGDCELMPYGQQEHEVIYSVSRRDLNCLMMTAAEKAEPVNVRFNQKCEAVDFEKQILMIRDEVTGIVVEEGFELLIGADGAGSRIRRSLIPAVNGSSESDILDHDYKELEIPAGAGGEFLVEKEALHVWPRGTYMLIALPNQDGSFTVTLFMPKTGETSFESLSSPEKVREFFASHFPDTLELIPSLEKDFFDHPQGMLGTVRCSPWNYKDVALILGDASHAIVPFHGQGMNAGFEDCSELIRLHDQHDGDWSKVLPEFDAIRRPNAHAIAEMALENYITMRESVADPLFQLKKEVGFELEKRFPNRFVPRYSMVMFHRLPYSDAFKRGEIQQNILAELAAGNESIKDINFELAETLVKQKLTIVDLDSPI
jgi:kynurenine 3-monooxygenase